MVALLCVSILCLALSLVLLVQARSVFRKAVAAAELERERIRREREACDVYVREQGQRIDGELQARSGDVDQSRVTSFRKEPQIIEDSSAAGQECRDSRHEAQREQAHTEERARTPNADNDLATSPADARPPAAPPCEANEAQQPGLAHVHGQQEIRPTARDPQESRRQRKARRSRERQLRKEAGEAKKLKMVGLCWPLQPPPSETRPGAPAASDARMLEVGLTKAQLEACWEESWAQYGATDKYANEEVVDLHGLSLKAAAKLFVKVYNDHIADGIERGLCLHFIHGGSTTYDAQDPTIKNLLKKLCRCYAAKMLSSWTGDLPGGGTHTSIIPLVKLPACTDGQLARWLQSAGFRERDH
jgi:hypothetical protein